MLLGCILLSQFYIQTRWSDMRSMPLSEEQKNMWFYERFYAYLAIRNEVKAEK